MASMPPIPLVDMHCHCPEMSIGEVEEVVGSGFMLVSVSMDLESSRTSVEYHGRLGWSLIPCVGIHPWEAGRHSVGDAGMIVEMALENNIKCLGEVGLDKVFVPKTFERQVEIFRVFLEAARDHGFLLNLHSPGTWRIVYDLLVKYDVGRAYFHWYTGPLSLLEDIRSSGYYIGINPAWRMQAKHRRIIEAAPLEIMLTESDAPYEYKGVRLSPLMVKDTVEYIGRAKSIDPARAAGIIYLNAKKLLGLG